MKAFGRSAVAALALACGWSGAARAADHLTYGIASYSFTYAPIYIAADAGFFAKKGLDITGELMSGSGVEASATIAGNIPFYVGLPQTSALAIAKGQKLNPFAEISQQYPMDIVISKEAAARLHLTDSTPVEQRLAALKGLRLADWTPGGAADMLIHFIAGKMGWNPQKDLTLLPIGPATAMIAALKNDRVDGFIWSAPSSDEAVRQLGAFKLYTGAKGEWPLLRNEVFNCLIGNPQWLASHRDEAIAIYQALGDAMDFMRKEPGKTKSLLRTRLKMFSDPDFEAGYANLHYIIPSSPKIGQTQADQVEDFMKTIDPSFKVAASALVDPAVGAAAEAGTAH
jgi:NitT/TauT family transport system substrate-binding protein